MGDLISSILAVIGLAFIAIFGCVIYGLILGFPIMFCWNIVMPVFGLSTLNFLQSAALGALMYIFFGKSSSSSK